MFDDLYPVAVEAGDRYYRKARVLQRDGQVRLLIDGGREVEVAAGGELIESDRKPGRRWVLSVDEGDGVVTWDVRRVGGCGCGSRLKRYAAAEAWA